MTYMDRNLRLPSVRPLTRCEMLDKARELIAAAGIREERELFELVNNLVASIDAKYASPTMDMSKAQLIDSACWLEGPRDEPELPALPYGGKERGQLDAFTKNVRHRHD